MSNIGAVIILYNPDIEIVMKNVHVLTSQVEHIVLVDNSDDLLQLDSFPSNVTYISYQKNLGIAEAQNLGIDKLMSFQSEYIILFDQDSDLECYDVKKITVSFKNAAVNNLKLACVGPRIKDIFSNSEVKPLIQKEFERIGSLVLCSQIIASGKMLSVEALKQIGLMESELFIDGVDHEWCWRARKLGFDVAINDDVLMEHTLGDARYKCLGITFKVASPIRLYYQFRNILLLSRRNYVPLYWKVRNIISIPIRMIVFGVIHPKSSEYLGYMMLGLKDGLKKSTGKINKLPN